MDHIAVVGAGQAGASTVETLRKEGFEGRITLWGAEAEVPYQRPPLSKAYLLGEMERERLFLRPPSFYDDQKIDLRLGVEITGIDGAARTLTHAGGSEAWDALVLTTGSTARRLPGAIGGDLDGVFSVRALADIDQMEPAFAPGAHLLVVGGGYIGLEAAAVARKRGMRVTLLEAAPRILARVASAETAAWIAAKHRAEGVEIIEGAALERLLGTDRVTGAQLADGTEIAVDAVVVGIGVTPNTALAEAAGASLDNGIAVDTHGQTDVPGIWAAGDCCSFPQGDVRLRLESVPHAIDQAQAVARNILGANVAYTAKPWFWSDQYDVKLQIAGLNAGFETVVVRDGSDTGEGLSHWYYAGDQLLSVDALNAPRAYMVGKRLIEAGRSPDPAAVADAATPIKALM
ncbi:pyridine nucleotide-disulfide oxidoreductase [Jannaschia pagri]|uniref:Pyridine nucleotide-disulfide oxidoreductase n=1 Tax=Jannaschia pagri TaxID=2829797 RepID=A0ABQ4NR55_9RHOB|nr:MULTISPECIES: FAD-dependent oxidoreductase [unclassified Jannaschia]GIT92573.1 pyridine nucleotide-disulfide oxidoreductase [Jannaschia sp. AI_61]GIT96567.1 pyridine nucleotide-disulfide oxidoreductase [Jannaschia sp. AI_62]